MVAGLSPEEANRLISEVVDSLHKGKFTPRMISRYTLRSSSEESRILGRKVMTQRGMFKAKQFSFHLSSLVNRSTKKPLFC